MSDSCQARTGQQNSDVRAKVSMEYIQRRRRVASAAETAAAADAAASARCSAAESIGVRHAISTSTKRSDQQSWKN